MDYAILCNPGHNRVYYDASLKMAIPELMIAGNGIVDESGCDRLERIGGVEYIVFRSGGARGGEGAGADDEGGAGAGAGYGVHDGADGTYTECESRGGALTDRQLSILSKLSFIFALFEIREIDGTIYLKPIELVKDDFIDGSISGILKYTGKTNEIFTKLLINVAYYTYINSNADTQRAPHQNDISVGRDAHIAPHMKSDVPYPNNTSVGRDALIAPHRDSECVGRNVRLFDPVAGKGTTLFEGLVRGFDVYGIEIGSKVVNESTIFLKKFLETARYKFSYSSTKMSGANKSYTAIRHLFVTAKNKEELKSKNTKTIEMVAGNSLYANQLYKKGFFDIIAGDLPYGVQHANVTNEKQSSFTRNPEELLAACLPSWLDVLKNGGVIALSWNRNVLPRENIVRQLAANGVAVLDEGAYAQFAHRVDQSIWRDVVVGIKN